MEKIILRQKLERDLLLEKEYVPRMAESHAAAFLGSGLIKLITGPRRAGKSVFALRMLRDKNFAYLNFDDKKLVESFDENVIYEVLEKVYPGYEYIVLDEIQNLPLWNDWVGKLNRMGINTVITGSNANLLSKEMESMLTGRYLAFEILPFSFTEFCEARKGLPSVFDKANDYIAGGGYPEIVNNRDLLEVYLGSLFESIISKDSAQRHKVRKLAELSNMAELMVSYFAKEITFSSLRDDLGMSSENTVKKFADYLQESYLFYLLPRFDNKLKLMQKAPRNVYLVDNGFIAAKSFEVSENAGRRLENMVFMELMRRGFVPGRSLFYYHTSSGDKEIDFVCRTGHRVDELVQVCYDISTLSTLKREMDALRRAAKELRCEKKTIVVWSSAPGLDIPDDVAVVNYIDWI